MKRHLQQALTAAQQLPPTWPTAAAQTEPSNKNISNKIINFQINKAIEHASGIPRTRNIGSLKLE